jgi:pyridoxal phosphate enzyme (YggS family)
MMIPFPVFESNLRQLRSRIQAACILAGRSVDSVQLLPVTKNHPVDAVSYAARAKDAVAIFNRVQSVDSLKLLKRLNRCAGEVGKTLRILLQCNTGEDPNKYGFSVGDMEAALEVALAAAHLKVEGLMTIAPLDHRRDVAKSAFERLRDLRDDLAAQYAVPLAELSMGMTGDLEAAIAAGSTQIRVGTALYGARTETCEKE